ncbi:hypothetical protein [Marinifilum fragile]|uniref:hypothetical protein n=1 Tax=Marinifilum fragile TaxID=570161 RepID=UPI002AA86EC2|nr:hypothetical protein [Marinifilum fragile]
MTSTTRLYNCSDAVFVSFSSQIISILEQEHSKFESFSTYFKPESLQLIKDQYNAASSIPSDKVHIDIQAKSTDNINKEVDECAKLYQRCKFDIELVFPNDKNIWNQFGFNDYLDARKSAKNMYMFYSDFQFMVNLHKEELMKIAWTEDIFAKIDERKNNLKALMNAQTKSMVERGRATEQRVTTLNVLYESLAKYVKAAKYIYEGNDEMLKWFKFPVTANGKKEETTEEGVTDEQNNE